MVCFHNLANMEIVNVGKMFLKIKGLSEDLYLEAKED